MTMDYGSEDEIEAGARFALKVRRAVREPERWALIIKSARSLMATVSTTPIPPTMDDVTLLALAYVASIRTAKNLPGEDIEGVVAGLKLLAGVA
jgi:hypothetical protein